jgi:AraC-like DNA-binding protein
MVRLDEGGRAASEVRILAPTPSLRRWVQHVSIQPGPARRAAGCSGASGAWRVVPDTSAHVILSVAGGVAWCRLVGARSTYADIDVTGRSVTVAVRLQPGALPALLGNGAATLTDRCVDFADALGGRAAPRATELASMPPIEAARLLLRAIERRCETVPQPSEGPALARASRVGDLAGLLGVSARRAHERIVDAIGLAPKRALRIQRLHATLLQIGAGHSLAAAALLGGYSDQAHFTRDAGALLGEPPMSWFARGADLFKTRR